MKIQKSILLLGLIITFLWGCSNPPQKRHGPDLPISHHEKSARVTDKDSAHLVPYYGMMTFRRVDLPWKKEQIVKRSLSDKILEDDSNCPCVAHTVCVTKDCDLIWTSTNWNCSEEDSTNYNTVQYLKQRLRPITNVPFYEMTNNKLRKLNHAPDEFDPGISTVEGLDLRSLFSLEYHSRKYKYLEFTNDNLNSENQTVLLLDVTNPKAIHVYSFFSASSGLAGIDDYNQDGILEVITETGYELKPYSLYPDKVVYYPEHSFKLIVREGNGGLQYVIDTSENKWFFPIKD